MLVCVVVSLLGLWIKGISDMRDEKADYVWQDSDGRRLNNQEVKKPPSGTQRIETHHISKIPKSNIPQIPEGKTNRKKNYTGKKSTLYCLALQPNPV